MIDFNVPLYIGKETDYMKEAIENKKICGDGMFTKKCNQWIEEKTGTKKALLTTSCTHATELAALLADIKEGDEVIMPAYTFVRDGLQSVRKSNVRQALTALKCLG